MTPTEKEMREAVDNFERYAKIAQRMSDHWSAEHAEEVNPHALKAAAYRRCAKELRNAIDSAMKEGASRRAQGRLQVTKRKLTPKQTQCDLEQGMATILRDAWLEYTHLFGVPPRGSYRQLYSMLALRSAGKRIAMLCAAAPQRKDNK